MINVKEKFSMKKKFIIALGSFAILLNSIFLIGYASSNSDAQLQQFKQQQQEIKKYIPYYRNLATCTPYKSDLYTILGKVNGQCHLTLVDTMGQNYDCSVPMSVAGVNSSYGKSVFNKIVNLNFDNMENKSIEELEKMMKDLGYVVNDVQALAQLEATMLKYHCKKLDY